jgi:O-antigen ligase
MVSNIRIIYLLGVLFALLAIAAPWFFMPLRIEYWKDYTTVLGASGIFTYLLYLNNFHIKFKLTYHKLPLLLLFAFAVLSLFWTKSIDFSISQLTLWISAFFIFIIVSSIELNKQNLNKLLFFIVFMGFLIAVIGIYQHLIGIDNRMLISQLAQPSSTFNNKNYAMQVLVLIVPVALYMFIDSVNKYRSYIFAFILSVILIYSFYSKTRSAWLGISLEFVLFFVLIYFYKSQIIWDKHKTFASIFAFILFIFFIHLDSSGFINAFGIISEKANSVIEYAQNTENRRYILYSVAWQMIGQNPLFGTGIGSFYFNVLDSLRSEFDVFGPKRVHNDVLQLVVELGIVGLLLFIGFVIAVLNLFVKAIKNKQNVIILSIVMIAFGGSFVNAMFSFPYQNSVPLIIFATLLAIFYQKVVNLQTVIKLKFEKILSYVLGIIAIIMIYLVVNWMVVENNINRIASKQSINNTKPTIYNPRFYGLYSVFNNILLTNNKDFATKLIDFNLEKIPNNIFLLRDKFKLLMQENKYNEAEQTAQKLYFGQSNYNYYGLISLITLYEQIGKKDLAFKYYNELKTIPEKYLNTHKIYYQYLYEYASLLGQTDDVVKFVDLYIKYKPSYSELKYVKILDELFLANKAGDMKKAINYYEILKLLPHSELIKQRHYYETLLVVATNLDKLFKGKYTQDVEKFKKYVKDN